MVAVEHFLIIVESAAEVTRQYPLHRTTPAHSESVTDATTSTNPNRASRELGELLARAKALVRSVRVATVTKASLSVNDNEQGKKKHSPASCFRWSDGVLVEALERGDWIVLDGANLCSARCGGV